MKLFFLHFMLFLLPPSAKVIAAPDVKDSFLIKGTVVGLLKGEIYINYKGNRQKIRQDTILVQANYFTYRGIVTEPTFATFTFGKESFSCYIESKSQIFFANKDSFSQAILTGSLTNDDFIERGRVINKRVKENEKNGILENINQTLFICDSNFIESHSNSYYSLYLLNFYFSDFQHNYLRSAFRRFDKKNQKSSLGVEMRKKLLLSKKTMPGKRVADFIMTDKWGAEVLLKDNLGNNKFILLDFWASWCVPCRKNSAFLRSIFNKYHNRGFSILSISFDKRKSDWTVAILKDSLDLWLHGIDDREGLIERRLGIISIPALILINDRREIIGRFSGRWKGKFELEKKIAELMKD